MERLTDDEIDRLQRGSLDLLDMSIPPSLFAVVTGTTTETDNEKTNEVACPATKLLLDNIQKSMETSADPEAVTERQVDGNQQKTNGVLNGFGDNSDHSRSFVSTSRPVRSVSPQVSWRACPDPEMSFKPVAKADTSSEFSSDDDLKGSVDLQTLDRRAFYAPLPTVDSPSEMVPLLQQENEQDYGGNSRIQDIQGQGHHRGPADQTVVLLKASEGSEVLPPMEENSSQNFAFAFDLMVGPEVRYPAQEVQETDTMTGDELPGSLPPLIDARDLFPPSPRLLQSPTAARRIGSPSFFLSTGQTRADSDSDSSGDISPSEEVKPDESVQSQVEIDTQEARMMLERLATDITSAALDDAINSRNIRNRQATGFVKFDDRLSNSEVYLELTREQPKDGDENEQEKLDVNVETGHCNLMAAGLTAPIYSNDDSDGNGVSPEIQHEVQKDQDEAKDESDKPKIFEYGQRMRFKAVSTTLKTVDPETSVEEKKLKEEIGEEKQREKPSDAVYGSITTKAMSCESMRTDDVFRSTRPKSPLPDVRNRRFFDMQAPIVQEQQRADDVVVNEESTKKQEDNKSEEGFGDFMFWSVPIPVVQESHVTDAILPEPLIPFPSEQADRDESTDHENSDVFFSMSSHDRDVFQEFDESNQRERLSAVTDSPKFDDSQLQFVVKVTEITEITTPPLISSQPVAEADLLSSKLNDTGAFEVAAQRMHEAFDRLKDTNNELCQLQLDEIYEVRPPEVINQAPPRADDQTLFQIFHLQDEAERKRKSGDLDTDQEEETPKCLRTSLTQSTEVLAPGPLQQTERLEADVIIRRSRSPTPTPIIVRVSSPIPHTVSERQDVSIRRSRSPTPTPVVILSPCLSPEPDMIVGKSTASSRQSRSRERARSPVTKRYRSRSPREKTLSPRAASRSPSPHRRRKMRSASPRPVSPRLQLISSPLARPNSPGEARRSPSPQPTRIPAPVSLHGSSPRRDPSPVPDQTAPLESTAVQNSEQTLTMLDDISDSVERMKSMSLTISSELLDQSTLLQDLDNKMAASSTALYQKPTESPDKSSPPSSGLRDKPPEIGKMSASFGQSSQASPKPGRRSASPRPTNRQWEFEDLMIASNAASPSSGRRDGTTVTEVVSPCKSGSPQTSPGPDRRSASPSPKIAHDEHVYEDLLQLDTSPHSGLQDKTPDLGETSPILGEIHQASPKPGRRSASPRPMSGHDEYQHLVTAQQDLIETNLAVSSEDRQGRRPRQKLVHKDSKDQSDILERLKTKYLSYLNKKFDGVSDGSIADIGFITDDLEFINALDALRRAPYFVGGAVLSEYSFMQDVFQYVVDQPAIFRTFKKVLEILFNGFKDGLSTVPQRGFIIAGNINSILINGSDIHDEFSKRLSEEPGLLELIIWSVKTMKNMPTAASEREIAQTLLTDSLNILYNCSMLSTNRQRLREVSTVETCLNYLDSPSEHIQTIALLCVAYLADEKQSEIFQAKKGPIERLIGQLKKLVADRATRGTDGWTKLEIIKGLGRLAVNDSNKRVISDCGALDVLLQAAQVEASQQEKLETLKVIWSLCFDQTNKELLKNNKEAMTLFEQTSQDKLDRASRKVAKGILWTIRDSLHHHITSGKEGTPHIMISYQWDARDLALKLRNALRVNGFAVWMDVDNMQGSTIEAMANAVETSAVVLMCVSRRYKESQNCRSEAEYAYRLKKEIIPVVVQKKYKPDGWLGLIMGAKMYYDITNEDVFQQKMDSLMMALGDKGKLQTRGKLKSLPISVASPEPQKAKRPRSSPQRLDSPRNWDNDKVSGWMESYGINRDRVGPLTGRQISFLRRMRRDAPDFYYSYINKNLYSIKMQEFADFSALTSAIEELDETVQRPFSP